MIHLRPEQTVPAGTKSLVLRGQTLVLSPNRTIFWQEQSILLVSDVHIGKVQHFRKNGIAVPKARLFAEINALKEEILAFRAKSVIFLGDLFHSHQNMETRLLLNELASLKSTKFILIPGNHDRFHQEIDLSPLQIEPVGFTIGPFHFCHDPEEACTNGSGYGFCGHLHPGISTSLKGNQHITLPCFLFTKKYAVLPAFSSFTGFYKVRKTDTNKIFGIAGAQIISCT